MTQTDDPDERREYTPGIKVVVFDIGGVVVGSPLDGISRYEQERGLPKHYLNVAITARGKQGAFQRLERAELDLDAFYNEFGRELSDEINVDYYKEYCARRKLDLPKNMPRSVTVDGWELFGFMMRETSRPDPIVIGAISRIRASGKFKISALTNNFVLPTLALAAAEDNEPESTKRKNQLQHLGLDSDLAQKDLRGLFDEYIESSVAGMRKPDPEFFEHACQVLKVKPHEIVFLDDIGINLKAARKMGYHTIRVYSGRSQDAIRQLGQVIGLQLLPESRI